VSNNPETEIIGGTIPACKILGDHVPPSPTDWRLCWAVWYQQTDIVKRRFIVELRRQREYFKIKRSYLQVNWIWSLKTNHWMFSLVGRTLSSRDLDIDKSSQTKTRSVWNVDLEKNDVINWVDKISNKEVLAAHVNENYVKVYNRWNIVGWDMFCVMTNYFVTLRKEKNSWETYVRQEKVATVRRSLWEQQSRTAEDRSAWSESTRKKVPKSFCTEDNWRRGLDEFIKLHFLLANIKIK